MVFRFKTITLVVLYALDKQMFPVVSLLYGPPACYRRTKERAAIGRSTCPRPPYCRGWWSGDEASSATGSQCHGPESHGLLPSLSINPPSQQERGESELNRHPRHTSRAAPPTTSHAGGATGVIRGQHR